MSTLASISAASAQIRLGENEPLKVYGFSARQIATLFNDHPQLIEIFREVRSEQVVAQQEGRQFALHDLLVLAIEKALDVVGAGCVGQAIIYALHENPKTTDEWDAAYDAVDGLPLEWQIQIIMSAFSLTMPQATANFRKAMEKFAASPANETDSNTGLAA